MKKNNVLLMGFFLALIFIAFMVCRLQFIADEVQGKTDRVKRINENFIFVTAFSIVTPAEFSIKEFAKKYGKDMNYSSARLEAAFETSLREIGIGGMIKADLSEDAVIGPVRNMLVYIYEAKERCIIDEAREFVKNKNGQLSDEKGLAIAWVQEGDRLPDGLIFGVNEINKNKAEAYLINKYPDYSFNFQLDGSWLPVIEKEGEKSYLRVQGEKWTIRTGEHIIFFVDLTSEI